MLISWPFVLTCRRQKHPKSHQLRPAALASGLKASELQQFHLRHCVSRICCLKLSRTNKKESDQWAITECGTRRTRLVNASVLAALLERKSHLGNHA